VTTVTSFDSFTRVDAVTSARHSLTGGVIVFPRRITGTTMNTFRPPDVTPDFNQSGVLTGGVDRFAIAPNTVLETTVSVRAFEINVNTAGRSPMVYGVETQSGSFFNDQEREVTSQQWVEALSLSHKLGVGEHVFKAGIDVQRSQYKGFSLSRPVEIRRLDGSLAERTVFGPRTEQDVSGVEAALFAQDRWHLGSRATLELGFRVDRDPVVERLAQRGFSAKLSQGNVYELPFDDSSFDLVVCFSVFEHLHEFERGLAQVARVLRPGGRFLLGMPAVNRMMEFGFRAIGFKGINDHHVTTPRAVSGSFGSAGLHVAEARTLDFPVKGVRLYYTWLLEKQKP